MQETIAIVGDGRLGRALASALRAPAPHGRGYTGAGADAVLLCVPDAQIAAAAAAIEPGPLVGHCSGATGLDVARPARGLRAAPAHDRDPRRRRVRGRGLRGRGHDAARARRRPAASVLALGMRPFEIGDEDRVAYHAAASMASNFLVTSESAAARVAATAGVERAMLVPLVRATVEAWAVEGDASLTGPIVRGDEATVARHREAIGERAPELLDLYDVMADATRAVAAA